MKHEQKQTSTKGHARGGVQAIALGPKGVTENDSPVINALKQKRNQAGAKSN